MSNATINCPSCGGAMNVPPGMDGMTVACAHCKRPFQVPDIAPSVFSQQIPDGPRRRSVGRSPGSNPWIWLAIGLPCAGVLIALLFVWKGSDRDLKQGQLLQLYQDIKPGMESEDAEKRVRALMAKVNGDLKVEEPEEDDTQQFQKIFEKGNVRIILFINRGTNKLVHSKKFGF